MAYTTIDKPSDYFNTVLYTGNNGSQTVTGLDFQPDWVWIKDRDGTERHCLTDSVRGVLQELRSNETAAESDRSGGTPGTGGVSAFNSNGFSLVHDDGYNDNNSLQVSWNWKAGGSASSNSNGSITSSVSANQTAGFSIVKYNSSRSPSPVQTVGHGLGVKPDMLIFKNLSETQNWLVWHKDIATDKHLNLNTDSALITDTGSLNNTAPTSAVFTIGADGRTNSSTNGNPIICYTFAEKKGYSKFGSYTGNGNADGTFVYTGFKPAVLLYKNTSQSDEWFIHDNKRQGFNDDNEYLFPSSSQAEGTANRIRFTSNGFKTLDSDKGVNASGNVYVYMAFAESPFVTSSGVPTTAR